MSKCSGFETVSIALLAWGLLASLGTAAAERIDDSMVRWRYDSSPDTPDGIAFSSYLGVFGDIAAKAEDDGLAFLVFSLELPDDPASRHAAQAVARVLRRAHAELEAEILASEIAHYCPGGPETRSNAQIYELMDWMDDENIRIGQRHYAKTFQQLDSEMAASVQRRLDRHKQSMYAIALDHEQAWKAHLADPDPDMRAVVAQICTDLFARRDQSASPPSE